MPSGDAVARNCPPRRHFTPSSSPYPLALFLPTCYHPTERIAVLKAEPCTDSLQALHRNNRARRRLWSSGRGEPGRPGRPTFCLFYLSAYHSRPPPFTVRSLAPSSAGPDAASTLNSQSAPRRTTRPSADRNPAPRAVPVPTCPPPAESPAPSPERRVPSAESRVPSPECRVPSPGRPNAWGFLQEVFSRPRMGFPPAMAVPPLPFHLSPLDSQSAPRRTRGRTSRPSAASNRCRPVRRQSCGPQSSSWWRWW
jgi:hypothetical protein